MHNLSKRLKQRGWSKKEIAEAVKIIKSAKQNKPTDIKFIHKRICRKWYTFPSTLENLQFSMYWILLVLIAVANFAVSVALLPLLVALEGIFLYFILILLGITFGLLFEIVIRSIEHLEKKHHIFLAILIPMFALVNIFIVSRISNNLARMLNLTTLHNPLFIALVYAISFVLPYVVYRFILKIEYYTKE